MEFELKPCPFCGHDIASLIKRKGRRGVFVYVQCEVCWAQTKTYGVDADFDDPGIWDSVECDLAVKAWNMRAGE